MALTLKGITVTGRASMHVSSVAPTTDPYFNSVSLLLSGDGTNGAQNNTFIDSSTNNLTITRGGTPAQGSLSPYSPDGWSGYFNGTTDYLTTASSSGFTFGTGNFTVEFWVNVLTKPGNGLYVNAVGNPANSTSVAFGFGGSGTNMMLSATTSSAGIAGATSTILELNTWYHIAWVKNGTVLKSYVNGVQASNNSSVATSFTNTVMGIGATPSGANKFNGYISNVRILNGTALYTTNFTPPTTPLTVIANTSLLILQDNRFKDNSTNNIALTPSGSPSIKPVSPFAPTAAYSTAVNGGSAYLKASDYLTASVPAIGTGDFTIETWFYTIASATSQYIFDYRPSGNDSNPAIYLIGGVLYMYLSGSNRITGTTPVRTASWYHLALVRSSGTTKMYLNGVQEGGNYTDANNYAANANRPVIGSNGSSLGGNSTLGYISDFRVTNSAVYTTAFTPPTAPLTAVSGTQLLVNMANAGIVDSSTKNDFITAGNVQLSTAVKKFGTASIAFDGTGDWMSAPNIPMVSFGTGNFTVEYWVYHNVVAAVSSAHVGVGGVTWGSADVSGWTCWITNGALMFNSNGTEINCGSTLAIGQWYHIAACRNNGILKIFVNGTQTYSAANTADMSTTTSPLVLGTDHNQSNSNNLNGYLDDVRITTGIARYTANFAVPTTSFPNQ
jgi:hypothetical protein